MADPIQGAAPAALTRGMAVVILVLAAAAVAAACWSAVAVRRVEPGEVTVVTRGGVVRRLSGPGLAWRLPVVESFEVVRDGPQVLPVGVRATTRDGVAVLVLLEATVSFPQPAPGTTYADPWPGAEVAMEGALATSVSSWTAAGLTHLTAADCRGLRLSARAALDGLGVEVHDLGIIEVDLRVAPTAGVPPGRDT